MKFLFNLLKPKHKDVTLTRDEETLLVTLNIANELGIAIKSTTSNKIEGLYKLQWLDEYSEDPKLKGIKSLINSKVTIPNMLQSIKELQSVDIFKEYHVFSCGQFGSDDNDYFIAGIKTDDQFECLRVFETNGINYNLETNNIIDFFKKWQVQARFSIIDAYHDRVIIQLQDFDFNLDQFCREALEFCPDFLAAVVDEGELKSYILERKGEVDFWWD